MTSGSAAAETPRPPLRIGLLGASSIAPTAMVEPARRRTDVEVVAVAAARPGAADLFADHWGVPRAHRSYAELVDDPEIDVVYVSIAAADHAGWSIAALEAGKHVLCEKPAAISVGDARRMVAVARSRGRQLLEAFHSRHHPLAATVSAVVSDLGAIRTMRSSVVGLRAPSPGSVLHDAALGGGALRHSGCYAVDWMRRLVSEEPVLATASAVLGPGGGDATSVIGLRFPGGAEGTVTSSFARDRTAADGPDLVVEASGGRLEVDGFISPHVGHTVRLWAAGEPFRQWTVAGRTSYDHQMEAVVEAVRARPSAPDDGDDLIGNAAVLEQAYRAFRG